MEQLEPGTTSTNVEVAIVMDVTGSMQNWINAARDTVLESFETLKTENPDSKFRLACICYRDIGDIDPFVIVPFTEDLSLVENSLKNIKANGGNDMAEDVAGALEHLLDLDWSKNSQTSQLILWCADAPAHGLRYHAMTVSDRYPKGDPNGREPSDQVRQLASKGIDFTLFRIDKCMDEMIKEFSEVYKNENINGGSCGTFTLLDVVNQVNDKSLTSTSIDLAYEPEKYSYSHNPFVSDLHATYSCSTTASVRKTIAKKSFVNTKPE